MLVKSPGFASIGFGMNMDDITPRAKIVEPVREVTATLVRFNKVFEGRCATDALYPLAFEAARHMLRRAGLGEVKSDFEGGTIKARFLCFLILPATVVISFYSAGMSTVVDAEKSNQKGLFRAARIRKGRKWIDLLCASPLNGADFPAASNHPEAARPPRHLG